MNRDKVRALLAEALAAQAGIPWQHLSAHSREPWLTRADDLLASGGVVDRIAAARAADELHALAKGPLWNLCARVMDRAAALRAEGAHGLSVSLSDSEPLCGDPHPSARGRSCTEPSGHAGDDLRGASHGDGRVDRWLRR